jgi:hypothetical protein
MKKASASANIRTLCDYRCIEVLGLHFVMQAAKLASDVIRRALLPY